MATHASHASIPPLWGVRYTVGFPYLDSSGALTDPTTPDTERSLDLAAFADCTEEATVVSTGFGAITLTSEEMKASIVLLSAQAASGPVTTPAVLYPRILPTLRTGTAQAGANGSITLDAGASGDDDFYNGCLLKTTGGTGGAVGSLQGRWIVDYNGGTKVASVEPNWETNPSSDTTFAIMLTELAVNTAVSSTVTNVSIDEAAIVTALLEGDWAAYEDTAAIAGTKLGDAVAAIVAILRGAASITGGSITYNKSNGTTPLFKADLTPSTGNYTTRGAIEAP